MNFCLFIVLFSNYQSSDIYALGTRLRDHFKGLSDVAVFSSLREGRFSLSSALFVARRGGEESKERPITYR